MAVSRNEAKDLLSDISRTERRSANAYGYSFAAPHFFLWGVIWMLGYGAAYLRPQWGLVFPVLSVIGIIGSFIIGRTMKSVGAQAMDWRYVATVVAVFLFVTAFFNIMKPVNGMQVGAFFAVLVGLFYALVGIWTRGIRMIVLGLVVGGLTMVGYFYFLPFFAAWMAVVGGAALILGGFWLRSL